MSESRNHTAHYFVDEAGCFTLFNRRGSLILHKEGVSRCLMVGAALLPDPDHAYARLEQVRSQIMNEPEFQNIPSVQRNRRKTALCFHAKDDHPRVRDQVFDVLPELNCKVQAAIRRKSSLAQIARYLRQGGQRLDADRVYDELVSRIFRDNLHKPSEVRITFARRGKSDRQSALRRAVERGRNNFLKKWNISSDTPVVIDSAYPSESAGLQIVDYYLWALQRLFERYEDAHFNRVSDQYSLVMDLDDKRQKPYGAWYSKRDPLPLKKLKPVTD